MDQDFQPSSALVTTTRSNGAPYVNPIIALREKHKRSLETISTDSPNDKLLSVYTSLMSGTGNLSDKNNPLRSYVDSSGVHCDVMFLRKIPKKAPQLGKKEQAGNPFEVWVQSTPNNEPLQVKVFLKTGEKERKEIDEEFFIHPQTGLYVSAMDSIDHLKFGDIVTIHGIKVTKTERRLDNGDITTGRFVNVSKVIDVSKDCLDIIYRSIHPTFQPVRYQRCDSDDDSDGEPKSKYSGEYFMIDIDPFPDLTKKMTSLGVTEYLPASSPKNWSYEDKNKVERTKLNPYHTVQQSKDGRPLSECERGDIERVFLDITSFDESLRTFMIRDCAVWKELAPVIMPQLSYIILAKVNIERTHGMVVNIQQKNELPGVGQNINVDPNANAAPKDCDFALNIIGTGVIFDAPSSYMTIGIPVSRNHVIDALSSIKMNPTLVAGAAPYSETTKILCLNETPDSSSIVRRKDIEDLYLQGRVEFRVITNVPLSDEMIDDIQRLRPEDGDLLIRCLNPKDMNAKNERNSKPADSPVRKIQLNAQNLIKYYFMIVKSRINSGESAVARLFSGKTESVKKLEDKASKLAALLASGHDEDSNNNNHTSSSQSLFDEGSKLEEEEDSQQQQEDEEGEDEKPVKEKDHKHKKSKHEKSSKSSKKSHKSHS